MAGRQTWARLYYNVSLIDCESVEALDELLATTQLQRYVVTRISPTTVVVDANQKAQVARALSRGHRPFRLIDLPSASPAIRADDASGAGSS